MKVDDLQRILEPQLPQNPIVLTSGPLLGMGDHAVYSRLAGRFKALGYDVYYDQDNAASNAEIFDLFYTRNPAYIGPSNLKPNAGYVNQGRFYELANRLPGCRSMEAMERAHGLPGPYSMSPQLNYEPQPSKYGDLQGTVLLDFSAVSSKIGRQRIPEMLKMMSGRYRNPTFLQVLHPSWVVVNQERYLEAAVAVTSVYEYIDMIAACRAWVGSEAGGQSLASAVRGEHDVYDEDARPEVVVLSTRQTYNSKGYTYRNVEYRVTANDGNDDHWSPHEINVLKYEAACNVRRIEMSQRAQRG